MLQSLRLEVAFPFHFSLFITAQELRKNSIYVSASVLLFVPHLIYKLSTDVDV